MTHSEPHQPEAIAIPIGPPPGTRYFLAFQACNSANFALAFGAPMVVTARYLGATETVIGALMAVGSFTIALAVLAPGFVERFGPRRLMLAGWGTRSFMLLLLLPLPFLRDSISYPMMVAWLLTPLAIFASVRGFASAGWLPWMSEILPEDQRGYFFGQEQRILNVSVFATLLISGYFLSTESPEPWRYSTMLLVGFLLGMTSLVFLYRIPGGQPQNLQAPLWQSPLERFRHARRVWEFKPFRRMARFVAAYTLGLTAMPVFLVLYVKENLGFGPGQVLMLQSASTLGVLTTAVLWGRLSDKVGSRPLLRLADTGQIAVLLFWIATVLGVIQPGVIVLWCVYAMWGVCLAMHAVAQVRLFLACCPPGEITLGTTLLHMIVAITAGASAWGWGFILDTLGTGEGPMSLSYLLMFLTALVVGILALSLLSRIPEPSAHPTRRVLGHIVVEWPTRAISGMMVSIRRPRGRP